MSVPFKQSFRFATAAFGIVLSADILLPVVFQSPPLAEHRLAFYKAHATFHAAVFVLSAIGATAGLVSLRGRLPRPVPAMVVSAVYGLTTVLVGPGAFMLAGAFGAAAWLFLGSMSFAFGSGIFQRPWRRPEI